MAPGCCLCMWPEPLVCDSICLLHMNKTCRNPGQFSHTHSNTHTHYHVTLPWCPLCRVNTVHALITDQPNMFLKADVTGFTGNNFCCYIYLNGILLESSSSTAAVSLSFNSYFCHASTASSIKCQEMVKNAHYILSVHKVLKVLLLFDEHMKPRTLMKRKWQKKS